MGKTKRKPRNKMAKKKPDLTVPLDISEYGSENDPCFGKLYDPRAPECQRCGDCEICSIVLGQNNHLLRNKIEKKQKFKDIEELGITKKIDPKVIRKSIRNRIREMARMGADKGVSITLVVDDVFASYFKDGFTKEKITRILNAMIEKSNKLTINKKKTHLLWTV